MKLRGLMILFIVLSSFLVVAGDAFKLDFTKKDQYIVGLKKGDMAEFYLNGERNVIIIDKIKPNSVDITAFIALNTRNYPYYTTLSSKRTLKIDVERDDIPDLYVGWYASDEDLKHVYLAMQKPEIVSITGASVAEIKREKRAYDKYIIGGFIFVVSLLILMIIMYRKKQLDNTKLE